jgi:hypothetical protein
MRFLGGKRQKKNSGLCNGNGMSGFAFRVAGQLGGTSYAGILVEVVNDS